ncbi:MAG TPA: MlaD family protein [Solirubrobacterales bacterium]|nr:MlaD family protein [Solirubrobacterales bacterium]
MRNRGGIQGVASSPVIVGAVTVLVLIVAVFLAYNANNGLPFVSTYNLTARVPNANAIVKGNEVRIGGARVGVVRGVDPVQLENGEVVAELDVRLDKSAEPIPVDSTMIIRPKSPLGLKYLQIVPGRSDEGFEAGDTIPVSAARPEPVDIDQFFNMFDEETRNNIRRSLTGFGNSFAGRGPQINNAFGALRELAESSQGPLRTLAAPSTNFGGFWRALEDLSATVAPVAETQASMFVALDRTFAAFARVSRPYIQETIEKSPRMLDAVTADLPQIRPFLRSSARFFTALQPGARAVGRTAPTINAALRTGIPVLNASPAFNAQLRPTAEALLDFQEAPGAMNGLGLLIDTNKLLGPAIRFIAPAQTKCNYLTLAFRNFASVASGSNGVGNWLNVVGFEAPDGPNAESQPSSSPASGKGKNNLHFNPYPRTAAPGQDGVCEAGNERYAIGQTVIGRAPDLLGTTTGGSE